MDSTVRALIDERAAATPRHPFVLDARTERVIDYATLGAAARAWARRLDAAGVPAGRRVLVDIEDPLAFAAVHLSLLAAGRCSAPVDPAAPPAEAERTRAAVRPSLVVSDRGGPGVLLVDRDTGTPVPTRASTARAPAVTDGVAATPAAGAALLLTSGSTGAPKAVVLTERQLLHVARGIAAHHRLTPADRGYNPLPLFHVNAQVVGVLATLVAGGKLVLDRRFRRTGFWPLIEQHRITWINAVPAILTVLARDGVPPAPPGLRFIRSASAPLPPAVRELVAAGAGVPVVESYGMTEAASQITATALDRACRPGSVGLPVGVELDVVSPDGVRCAPDTVGRVRIRGGGVIRGYADGVATDRFDGSGWLDTGDLGRLDPDGHLYLVGRADDVINRGGELVHPREVEEVLLGDQSVVDAVVVGRPDAVLGAVPVACVRPTGSVDPDGVAELVRRLGKRCADHLSRFKRPAEIRVVGVFPVGPTGKVRRRALREQLAEEAATAGAGQ